MKPCLPLNRLGRDVWTGQFRKKLRSRRHGNRRDDSRPATYAAHEYKLRTLHSQRVKANRSSRLFSKLFNFGKLANHVSGLTLDAAAQRYTSQKHSPLSIGARAC